MARRNWFQKIADIVKDALGIKSEEPTTPETTPPEPTPPQGAPRRGVPPFLPQREEEPEEEEDRTYYMERDRYVLPRWKVDEPSIGDIERLARASSRRKTQGYYTIIITGIPKEDSPRRNRKLGPNDIVTLSYVKPARDLWDAIGGSSSAEEWTRNLLRAERTEWTYVQSVDIVDR